MHQALMIFIIFSSDLDGISFSSHIGFFRGLSLWLCLHNCFKSHHMIMNVIQTLLALISKCEYSSKVAQKCRLI